MMDDDETIHQILRACIYYSRLIHLNLIFLSRILLPG
jgi:hypothetical protein